MTGQSSRFASYGKGTPRDASASFAQPRNNVSANWNQPTPTNLWSTHITTTFSSSQNGLPGHDESFANSPETSNAFPDSAAVWPAASRSWNNDNSTPRRASASPSPAHMRDASQAFHDRTPSNASYLTARTPSSSFAAPRPNGAGPSLDSNAAPFRYRGSLSSLRNSMVDADGEADGPGAYTSFGFDAAERPQELSGGFGAAPTASAMPPPSHGGHSHRPSHQAAGPSFPSPASSASQLSYQRPTQADDPMSRTLADLMLRQNLGGEDRTGPRLASPYNNLYTTPGSGSLQFNPVSQSWDVVGPRGGLGGLEAGDPSVGGTYRQVTGARGLGGPVTGAGQWSRPVSRDPRLSGFHDGFNGVMGLQQRPPAHNLAPEQHQFDGAPGMFPSGVGSFYNAFGSPIATPQLGLHPLGAPFLPPAHMQVSRDRDPARAFRSPLLDEYRASRTSRRFELKDIYDHIVEFSGDQHGSRFIQSKLETANSDEKEHVFREISVNTLVLMQDVFGNYVVQKFFEHGNQVQKKYLAEQMKGKIVDLSTQTYACRVVQKALQHILVDQQVSLARELELDVIRVVKDPNGNHVIQKVIELVPREHVGFIIDAFRGRVRELSAHNYGCRVIQRMLEHGLDADKELILAELHDNAMDLINDQYGNYVAQHVIQFGKPSDREKVITRVLDQLVVMSNNKFASNVVEKCVEFGTAADHQRIREELCRLGHDGQPVLQQMVKDQYGNYVIQKLLKQLKGEDHQVFVGVLSTQLTLLRRSSTGRQNAAIDRLATAIEETSKASKVSGPESVAKKPASGAVAPGSPQLVADQDSTPSLTSLPTSPESSNPPSVSAGSPGGSPDSEDKDSTSTAKAVEAAVGECAETAV